MNYRVCKQVNHLPHASPEPWFSALGIEDLVKPSPPMGHTASPFWVQMRPQRHRIVLKVKMIKWQMSSRG